MKRARAAMSLIALFAASYAWAAAPEARLGGPVVRPSGGPRPAGAAASGLPTGGGLAYGRALSRLQPEAAAATRGAAETRVYQKAAPSVVLIVSDDGLGSGSLISADGKILTNLHVVGAAREVGVIFKPAMEGAAIGKADIRRAKVLQVDEVADLALVQVAAADVPAGVTPLAIGNSTTVQVGADVHAIGHPTGEAWTYTRGIVSQVRRAYSWSAEDKVPHEATVIQTQTPINPGNSGGPLLNDNLEIVGVNSFKSEGEGLNFAVSAEDVKSFLARGGDRLVNAEAKAAAAKACEPVVLEEARSDDPKGVQRLVDLDCDGREDGLWLRPDSKREPITFFFDDDGDGKYDTLYLDDRQDGQWDNALYDTDGDGEPDLMGYFRKGESEPYKWEKMKPR